MPEDGMFGPALRELEGQGVPWREFGPFEDYKRVNGGAHRGRVADLISVQDLSGLDPELRAANTMVFRLGSPEGARHTHFALVRAVESVEEFFLLDDELFGEESVETYLPEASAFELFPYQLLGTPQEMGAVNLAVASGLLGYALDLDEPRPRVAPATGRSTYSFKFRPHSAYDVEFSHQRGQVETDAVFFGRRNKRWTLFVIEAKISSDRAPKQSRSLSKAKLAYAVAALGSKPVPSDVTVVPVYMRVEKAAGRLLYSIAECAIDDVRRPAVDSVSVIRSRRLALPFSALGGL